MEPLTREIVARKPSFLRWLPVLLAVLASSVLEARTVDVRLTLPVRARLDLTNKSTLIVEGTWPKDGTDRGILKEGNGASER